MSLQGHTRPSFQSDLDLHTATDKLKKRQRKRNVVFVPVNVFRETSSNRFFLLPGFTEMVSAYTHDRSVSGCVYSTIVNRIMCILSNEGK